MFTQDVLIDDGRLSHSHPVLTIGAKSASIKTDLGLLSVYLHEQVHWFLSQHPVSVRTAIAELKLLYPQVKVGTKEGGAQNEKSSYLHLLVCLFEYDALLTIVGGEARNVLSSKPYYKWIYSIILSDDARIREIALRNGLIPQLEN